MRAKSRPCCAWSSVVSIEDVEEMVGDKLIRPMIERCMLKINSGVLLRVLVVFDWRCEIKSGWRVLHEIF